MVKLYNAPVYADTTGYDVRPSNSSRPVYARDKTVDFDKDASFYDMSGYKYMIILNQHIFERTKHFNRPVYARDKTVDFDKDASFYDMSGYKYMIILNQHIFERTKHFKPSTRRGTYNDEWRLQQLFHKLGFLLFVLRDLTYKNIINFLSAFAALEHERTSCICVTILTHGDTGGQIFAADRPYLLDEVMNIFANQRSLTNKPKLFFVQACRGEFMDPGHTVYLGRQCDSVYQGSQCDSVYQGRPCDSALTRPTYYSSEMPVYYSASEERVRMMPPRHADVPLWSVGWCCLFDLFKACRNFWTYAGNTDATRSDSQNVSILTVPTHADILVLRSTVENYLSYRDGNGSWMIQVLCDTIEEHHEDLNLFDMIIQMNRTVAYEKITCWCKYWEMNNKKQMPETRFTLTKNLKFQTVLSKAQCSFSDEEATTNVELLKPRRI